MKISELLLLLSGSLVMLFSIIPRSSMAIDQTAAQEIDQLLRHIEISNCAFNRNDRWYDAKEAAAHLKQKYRYAQSKGLIRTAEDFIRLVATKSSLSGKPYMVQCAGETPQKSGEWLTTVLKQLRQIK